jgi:hypothetical protein
MTQPNDSCPQTYHDKYSEERYNPTIAHCSSQLSLRFDGKTLTIYSKGKKPVSFPADSGKMSTKNGKPFFDYSKEQQKKAWKGPIPEGTYWVKPSQIDEKNWYQNWGNTPARSWGNWRLTIHPFTTTDTYCRGGFFIHGGSQRGSAGCIDLTNRIEDFFKELRDRAGSDPECQVHLTVSYP